MRFRQKHLTAICAACYYVQEDFTVGEVSEFHCVMCWTKNIVTDIAPTTAKIEAVEEE